jgi:hypothetical protein
MLGTGLEFAPGTTEDCQRLVVRLFQQPAVVLVAYRAARERFRTGDIVLETAEHDPSGFKAMPRADYVAAIKRGLGRNGAKLLAALGVAHKSGHQVASLPRESDAFWLIVNRKDALPIMVVLFSAPYAAGDDAHEPTILS